MQRNNSTRKDTRVLKNYQAQFVFVSKPCLVMCYWLPVHHGGGQGAIGEPVAYNSRVRISSLALL